MRLLLGNQIIATDKEPYIAIMIASQNIRLDAGAIHGGDVAHCHDIADIMLILLLQGQVNLILEDHGAATFPVDLDHGVAGNGYFIVIVWVECDIIDLLQV